MYFMKLKINWEHPRCKHALERMWLRGISHREVKEAIVKGQKIMQRETKLIESIYRYFSVVYDEMVYKKVRKVFPVTVKIRVGE